MPEKVYKPTVRDILDLHESTKKIYDPLYSKFDNDDDMYELNFKEKLNMPDEYKDRGIVLPTARDYTDSCVDHTNVYNARVFVNKKGTSALSEKQQEKLRKICTGLLYRTNVEATISPWRVASKHFWVYGLAVFKTVWDADLFPEYPKQKDGESEAKYAARLDEWRSNFGSNLPVAIKAVHPRTIMPDPYEEGGRFVFETREILVYDVKKKYPLWGNPQTKAVDQKVEWISYWDRNYRCELFDKEPIAGGVRRHNYGFIPYTFIDTGLGNIDAKNDPVKRYVGILRYVTDLLVSESRNYSISDVVLALEAWPWYTAEGVNAQNMTEVSRKFGEVTRMPPETKIVQQTPQLPPQALNEHLYRTSGYLASHISPNASRGQSEEGVRSAAHFREVMGQVTTRYQYSTEAFKHGAAKVLSNSLRVMKNVIPGEFNVWARTPTDEFDIKFNKDDLVEPFTCYVEFAPVSEEDEYRRHDDAERLVAAGIISRRTARKQMSNVDPDDEERQETKAMLRADPAMAQFRSAMLQLKLQPILGQQAAAQALASGQPMMPMAPGAPTPMQGQAGAPQAGRRMIPPIPATPTPGSAQGIQNELKSQRSRTPMSPTQGRGGGGNRP